MKITMRLAFTLRVAAHQTVLGEILLEAAAVSPRSEEENRRPFFACRNCSSLITPDLMPEWPEAFVLYFQNTARIFTIETPSEFHLDDRVDAQFKVISKAVELCRKSLLCAWKRPRHHESMSREASIERTTSETSIRTRLNIDGKGVSNVPSGIAFFDHMLTLFARHALFDLDLDAKGTSTSISITLSKMSGLLSGRL